MNIQNTSDELTKVLQADVCIGCGACAFASGSRMVLDERGFFRPSDEATAHPAVLPSLCPMLAPELNEDVLADRLLPETPHRSPMLGKYTDLYAAHVEEGTWRRDGSSGGFGSWIAAELLAQGEIDGVIHARPVRRQGAESPFFRYGISRSIEEIRSAAHSHYHVVELSEVLREVREVPGRYLFFGIPCMVKALRRVQLADPLISERISYTVALICGHLKSVHWALSLGWGKGVPPEAIEDITFRVKDETHAAKSYYVAVGDRRDGAQKIFDSASVVGGKFNLGTMMPEGCNFCDDVVGETADITIGDAWLPRYAFDWRGKNMLVVRHPRIAELLREGANTGRLSLEPMTHLEAVDAQAGGFRQRREGLAYRIKLAEAQGRWVPEKRRFEHMGQPGPLRRWTYRLRMEVTRRSTVAFVRALAARDLSLYEVEMAPILRRLRRLEIGMAALRIAKGRLRAKLGGRRT